MERIKKTVVSCTTRRGLSIQTLGSVQGCPFKGVSLTQGITDVALARCVQYKAAVAAVRDYRAEMVLFVDDDMFWTPEAAEKVLEECERLQCAVSGRYVSGGLDNATLAASKIANQERYLTGLGFLSVPVKLLEALLDKTPRVKWNGQAIPAVTACGPMGDQWISEDYMLTAALGGAVLSSVEIGHVKPCVLFPGMFAHLKEAAPNAAPSNLRVAPATS